MEYLRVKNWEEFQHYKDRNPPWIKLHRALLDNYEFCSLPDAQKAHLVLVWIHASQNDGLVPNDAKFLENKLSCTALDLNVFIEAGFLIVVQDASNMLADRKQSATKSVRLEEERREEKKKHMPGKPDVIEVLTYLNQKAKRNYRAVDANTKLIAARLGEGATVSECKAVIDAKVKEWAGDPKMSDFLRPETLFNATKFAQYVGKLGSLQIAADGGVVDPRFKGAK